MVTVYNDHPSASAPEADLQRIVSAVLEREGATDATVSVVLCDREAHLRLHREFLGHDYPTDVLAFTLGDEGVLEGEVYVDLDTARERHADFGASFHEEVARYVIHGTLHLLGFDDDAARSAEMKAREDAYVDDFRSKRF